MSQATYPNIFGKVLLGASLLFGVFRSAIATDSPPRYTNITAIRTGFLADTLVDTSTQYLLSVLFDYKTPIATANQEAVVYCGAFLFPDTSSKVVPFKTNSEILKQGFSASSKFSEGQDSAYVLLSGLIPSSIYKVYCMTVSAQDTSVQMPYAIALKTNTFATTLCCKMATFSTAISSMFTGKSSVATNARALTLTLSAAPTKSDLSFTLQLYSATTFSTNPAKVGTLSQTFISIPTTYTPGTPISIVLVAGRPDIYKINVTMSGEGTAADEYELIRTGATSIEVLSNTSEPNPPLLQSAAFAADGSFVTVTFDSATAGSNTFTCGDLLIFKGSSNAVCTWVDNKNIAIYPTYTEATKNDVLDLSDANSQITLRNGRLRALCTDPLTKCTNWVKWASGSARVTAPLSATLPKVTISGPSTVGPCSPILLDLSNTVGNAGRPWKSQRVTVSGALVNATLTSFLNSTDYKISPPTAIARELLNPGNKYVFTGTFCNFLGACNQATKEVTVSTADNTPVVSIVGLSSRSITARTPLQISASAYTQTCGGGQSVANLKYTWSLFEVSANLIPVVATSTSQNPASFRLNAYSLQVGTTYQVTVSVSASGGTPVTASVLVNVISSDIVPSIVGGTSRQVQQGTDFVLDASKSQDLDVAGVPTGLKFAWSCFQTAPVYNSVCALSPFASNTDGSSAAYNSSKLTINSDVDAVGSTFRVSVNVYDATRTSSTYMDITITAEKTSTVVLTSNLASLTSINVNQPMQINAAINLVGASTCSWSVQGVDWGVGAMTTSPLSKTFGANAISQTNSMSALIAGGALPQRATLAFALTCVNGDKSASASIAISTNGAPLPGTFEILPTEGWEMKTPFTFSASRWNDPDLPLSYQFGFISPTTSSLLVIQGKSEASFATTKLAAGPYYSNFAVNGTLQVYDVYGAAATAQDRVQVKAVNATEQIINMRAFIAENIGSVDGTKAIIGTGGAALNAVNCTGAPNCAALRRHDCSVKAQTCGTCLGNNVGVPGPQNSLCLTLDEYVQAGNRRRLSGVVETCTVSSECTGSWESCVNGKCVQQQKACGGETPCSGHGVCHFENTNDLSVVYECGYSDSTCAAVCTCEAGWADSSCSSTVEELQTRSELRSQLIRSLQNVTSMDDISEDSLIVWSDALQSLTQNGDELSESDVFTIHRIANLTIAYAKEMKTQNFRSFFGLLESLNNAGTAATTHRRSRRLSGRYLSESDPHNDILSVAGSFGDVILNGMSEDQPAEVAIYDNFRMSTQVTTADGTANIEIAGPQSDMEFYANAATPYVDVTPGASGNVISSSVLIAAAKSYEQIADKIGSNPLQVRFGNVDGVRKLSFSLINNGDLYKNYEEDIWHYNCTRKVETVTHLCEGSGQNITAECTGIVGVKSVGCPRPAPQCAIMDSVSLALSTASDCRIDYTQDYRTGVTCTCTLDRRRVLMDEHGRRLESVSGVLEATGVTNMVTTSTYIASQFAGTFNAAKNFTSPEDARAVLIVILMFACLWAVGLLSLVGLCFKRQKRITKTSVEKRRSHKAGSQTHTTTDIKKYLLAYVEKLIPDVYSASKSKVERAVDETRKHHRYLQLFTARDDQISVNKRIITLTKMLTVQTMLMFLLAVLYDLQGPSDDGSCEQHSLDKDKCLSRKSILDSSQEYCRWAPGTNGEPLCEYAPPVFTAKIMMYIIILTSIFTSIFNTPIDKLFDTLEAPTGATVGESRLVKGAKAVASGARRVSVAAIGATKAVVAAIPKRMTMFQRITNQTEEDTVLANRRIPEDVTFAHTMAYMALPAISAQAQVSHLRQTVVNNEIRSVAAKRMTQIRGSDKTRSAKKPNDEIRGAEGTEGGAVEKKADHTVDQFLEEIMQQRLILPAESEETTVFDTQWGIEKSTSTSADGKTVSTSLFINGHSLRGMSKDVTGSDERVKELKDKMEQCSDNQVGLDILHLFMVDLLGRHTLAAKIFENKFEEDFERTRVVSKWVKWLTLFLIIGLNGFFMYYSLLKGFSKGIKWQNQYLQGCITQLIIEIFLFESMECVWINYWVPDLVSNEVMQAGIILRESAEKISLADKYNHGEDSLNTKYFLDAPSYLFVSTKLAKKFPNLLESIIVTSYHNHLPGEIARTWRNERAAAENERVLRNSYAGKKRLGSLFFSCVVALSSGLAIMLQALGSLPYFYQRVIIRFVQPVFLSGLTLLWYFAIKNPIYIGVLAAAVILIVFVLYIRFKNRENNSSRPGKIQPVTPISEKLESGKTNEMVSLRSNAGPLNQPAHSNKQYSSSDNSSMNNVPVRAPKKIEAPVKEENSDSSSN